MSPVSSANVAAHLPEMARLQPEAPAIYIPHGRDSQQQTLYDQYTFAELDRESSRMAHALESIGIRRGVRTVLMVPPGFEFFALTFALFKIGAVPVLVDPGMGVKNLKTCFAEAQPQAFIGISKAHLARILLGWGKPTVKTLLTVGRRLCWGGATLEKLLTADAYDSNYETACTADDDIAAILFTSGSTGVPKGAVYSHGNFSAQVEMLHQVYNIRPGEIDLPTFPLFALFAPALGMTSVIPEMNFTRPADVDPVKIIAAIERFQITTMFGSPALINRVGRYGEAQGIKLPSLKRAISAGAPVSAAVLERFTGMLSAAAQVFTPYGATEALPVCSIGSAEILAETRHATDRGRGVCVGKPVPGIELEIIAIADKPIACWETSLKLGIGEIGEIVVKGPQVTRSYFNRPQSTALGKIPDPEHDGFYHRMGDLGYRDEQGRIWFCGRKAHRVVTTDETLFTIPCEAIFNTHQDVFRTALVGVGEPGRQRPVLCIELEQGTDTSRLARIHQELLAIGAGHTITRNIKTFLFHPAFPVDIRHNAKIFREQLATWAREKLS
ncbi:MAG: fatty acid CoA ligase family protein [Desulfuromonadales bacterium]|nr:fatty acid CoA ligase family protein [Desulfuromonadales bacterium]